MTFKSEPVRPPPIMARQRIGSIDLLRGLVMVIMALDHTRDFFGTSGANPRDVTDTALFITRWVTHYCAPTFIMLAGLSAYLYGQRGRSTGEVSWYLFSRGFWLIVLEFTLVRFGWSYSISSGILFAQVIWVIGVSMIVLAALVHMPRWAIASVALVMIAGHNALDGIRAQDLGSAGWFWTVLHERGLIKLSGATQLYVLYPLVPWIGVMAAGYALGPIYLADRTTRLRWLVRLGAAITIGFVILRASNLYGDPQQWTTQTTALATLLSFLNCEKYPPSLLYLMMTLGPALLLLAAFEGARGRLSDWITVFGRVPLLYYVAHIYLIHALAIGFALAVHGDASWLLGGMFDAKPKDFGVSLPVVYAVWMLVVITLYPLCRWFADIKHRHNGWWWSYL